MHRHEHAICLVVLFFCHFIVLLLFINEINGDEDGYTVEVPLSTIWRYTVFTEKHFLSLSYITSRKVNEFEQKLQPI